MYRLLPLGLLLLLLFSPRALAAGRHAPHGPPGAVQPLPAIRAVDVVPPEGPHASRTAELSRLISRAPRESDVRIGSDDAPVFTPPARLARASHRDRQCAGDVVRSFRLRHVRLLHLATAPPPLL